MNSSWGNSLLWAFLASWSIGAAEAAPQAEATAPARLNGLLQGRAEVGDAAFAPASVVSLAVVKELGDASAQMRVWLEEVLAAASAVTLAAAAVLAFRRKRRERDRRLQTLYEITEMPAALSERQTPRYLPSNPYRDAAAPELLSRQIENAAEASLEFGRVLGVIYFDLGPRPQGDFSEEARQWDADQAELIAEMQRALRRTDHVAALSDREIVACIALLPGRSELAAIAGRLRKIGQNSPRFGRAFAPAAGLAIYPACGYRGEELIEYARADYIRGPSALIYSPSEAASFDEPAFPKP